MQASTPSRCMQTRCFQGRGSGARVPPPTRGVFHGKHMQWPQPLTSLRWSPACRTGARMPSPPGDSGKNRILEHGDYIQV